MAGSTPVEYHPNPGELAFSGRAGRPRPRCTLEPGFNVVFAGNLGTVQALDTVLAGSRAAARCCRTCASCWSAAAAAASGCSPRSRRLGLSNVQLPGRFPPQAMPGILAQASALLVSLTRDPIMSQTVPSKIQAYLAAGRPSSPRSTAKAPACVEESGAGVVCAAEDAAALADAVLRLHGAGRDTSWRGWARPAAATTCNHFEPGALARRLVQRFDRTDRGRPRRPGAAVSMQWSPTMAERNTTVLVLGAAGMLGNAVLRLFAGSAGICGLGLGALGRLRHGCCSAELRDRVVDRRRR